MSISVTGIAHPSDATARDTTAQIIDLSELENIFFPRPAFSIDVEMFGGSSIIDLCCEMPTTMDEAKSRFEYKEEDSFSFPRFKSSIVAINERIKLRLTYARLFATKDAEKFTIFSSYTPMICPKVDLTIYDLLPIN